MLLVSCVAEYLLLARFDNVFAWEETVTSSINVKKRKVLP